MRKEDREKLYKQILDTILSLPPNTLYFQLSGSRYLNENLEFVEDCSVRDIARILKDIYGYNIPLATIKIALQPLKIKNNYYGKIIGKTLDKQFYL